MSVQFALIAAQMYLSIITQPRPKRLTFQDLLDSNKGDETRPIPYIRGRWKTKPQRIWLGDFSARAVERDSVWTDFVFFGPVFATLLDTITVGYRYYVGQGFALTWGPINRVHQVYVQDLPCAVAPVVDNAGGSLLLDDPQLFGGDQPPGAGGVYGICDVIAGNYTQGRNAYLQSIEGNMPALHGVAALIIRGRSGFTESGYFSANTLELREWQVELMAWPDVLATGNAQLPDQSFNRIHALYEWATAADYGAEYPAASIHLPSWRAAAATCYDEGLGFSGEINTGGNVGEVFDQLRASVDAEVYEHPRDGLKIKLIRKDYSIPALKVLDESNLSSVEEYTPGDNADTFNRVTLNYINAENNYQPRPAVYEDPANFHLQRRLSSRQIEYPGVASAELAQKLVTRDGRALAQPFPPLTVNAGDDGEELWPGEVYQFQWRNPLVRKVFRVHSRTPGVSYDGERNFRLTSTEDQYSIGMSVFGAPGGTDATNPADVWSTAPPSASWDSATIPTNGLRMDITTGLSGEVGSFITGAIEFGVYAGGQYARLYVTPPDGEQTLTPMRLSPDGDNKAQFTWPALVAGEYEFCVQTFSIVSNATNGVKVCAETLAASFSVSPSASQSPSASESPSISPSSSPSPSASVSPSSSTSPSVSPSASVSLSASPSSSVSPSASQSPSASVSPSSSASLSLSPSSSASPSVSPGGTGPGARVSRGTAQTLAHNTETAISFTTEDRDDGGFFDAGAPTKFTVGTAGWYFVGTTMQVQNGVSPEWQVTLRQNGSMTLAPTNLARTGNSHDITTTSVMYFNSGDYVEATAKQVQSSPGSLDVENAAFWVVYVGASGVALQRAANQSIATGTATAVEWDTEDRDDNAYHDLVTDPSRLTAATTGWYVLGAYAHVVNVASSHTILEARLNGSTIIAAQSRLPGTNPDLELTLAYKLTAGDYVEFLVTQNAGANRNVTGRAWMGLRASGSGAYVTRTTSVTVPDSTETAVPFTAETVDDDSFHDTSSDTTRMTIRNTGWHIIGAYTQWDNSQGFRRLAIRSGGSTTQAEQSNTHAGGTVTRQLASTGVYLSAADYAEETLFHTTTGAPNRLPATHRGWILELG